MPESVGGCLRRSSPKLGHKTLLFFQMPHCVIRLLYIRSLHEISNMAEESLVVVDERCMEAMVSGKDLTDFFQCCIFSDIKSGE